MLKRVYVDNYKCLVNFELRFGDLALLLGPNGAGKSSVVDVVFALREILSGRATITDPDAFPTRTLTRWQSRPLQTFELEVLLDDRGPLVYRLEVEHERETGRARIARERLGATAGPLFEFEMGEVRLFRDDHTPGPTFRGDWSQSWLARVAPARDNARLGRFLDFVRSFVVCSIDPRRLAAESRGEDADLQRDASNFVSWYRSLIQERPDLVQAYVAALSETVDGLRGMRLEKVGQEARVLLVAFEEGSGRYELRLDELSDGQRALVVLYALVHLMDARGAVLFLDEPENFVALPEIQPWLTELSSVCGTSLRQAVLGSHHPELIDYFGAEYGLFLEREGSGPVTVRRLVDRTVDSGLRLSELVARGWES